MSNEHKRTFRLGSTKVTTHISEDDPVFKGVMHAAEVEGGQFPDHVGHIKIKPDKVPASKKDAFICGRCRQTDQGGSEVHIYAGSIKEVVDPYLVDLRVTNVTLHEFGHSLRGKESQDGAWLGCQPSEAWEEEDAEKYVKEKHASHQAKNSQGKPKTWKGLFAFRKQQQESNQS